MFRRVSRGWQLVVAAVAIAALPPLAQAGIYDLTVDRVRIDTGDFVKTGIGYNGTSPGPVLRFQEGEEVTINVTNNLNESTSIHWHGLILPFQQDGVPGISFDGIAPGETFTYRFPIVQSGTYWFHSHSGLQEPDGAFGAIVIEPKEREPFRYDRDYVVQLTDKHRHGAERIMRNLKMMPDYYNRQQRTLVDFFADARRNGFADTLKERAAWGRMRMMPTDIEDVQGFVPLINGKGPEGNWTGLFEPGERVRLRFINSSAMAYFDMRIPGLEMTVVQADGQNVQPVKVDELRIAVAETFDVIVRPTEDRAYTIFAESMGRTAYGRGTLAPRDGMTADVPEMRDPPLLTMADMGMAHAGMDHGAMTEMDGASMQATSHGGHRMPDGSTMPGMQHQSASGGHQMPDGTMMPGMDHAEPPRQNSGPTATMPAGPQATHQMSGDTMAGMDHSTMRRGVADPFYADGSGLTPAAAEPGGKFLSYADLRAQTPLYLDREPTREIEVRLTGNMERYAWSINGVQYSDAEPIVLHYGERVRFKFVNETMMTHPMHLHGMWSILDNGNGERNPVKHTISVAPGTTLYTETEVDAPGQWAFHCHLSYHAATGMFRKVVVQGGPTTVGG